MNFKQLTFAREFRGLSQTELAKEIEGLSQSNLSKFEKGLSTLSENLQTKIINYLGFPKDFYDTKIYNVLESSHYRKKSTINKSEILNFEQTCKLVGYLIDEMSQEIEWPVFKLKPLNIDDGYSIKKIASYTRKSLGLDSDEPVKNIFQLLESSGIIIYEINALDKFDGISFITKKGYPVIILNKSFSNDRKRFTLAHELGHLILHDERNFIIPEYRNDKVKEDEANQFASEFLMPEHEIKDSLRNIQLKDLAALKRYWLTSMSSLIKRAKDLGCVDDNRYKYFIIELSRLGYRKHEPVEVFIDNPKVFNKAYELLVYELDYSIDELSVYFKLPKNIINDIFEPVKEPKLRVLDRL